MKKNYRVIGRKGSLLKCLIYHARLYPLNIALGSRLHYFPYLFLALFGCVFNKNLHNNIIYQNDDRDFLFAFVNSRMSPVGDFRPLSCCHTTYKMISKIIANKLRVIFLSLISENQTVFIKRRLLGDNFLLVLNSSRSSFGNQVIRMIILLTRHSMLLLGLDLSYL